MSSVNKAIILGRLGADPEIRTVGDNTFATVRVATTETWKDKSGQRQESTEWHTVTLFNKLADIAGKYLKKGSSVYFEGKIKTRKWQDKDGADRYTTEVHASEMRLLGGKSGGDSEPAAKSNDQGAGNDFPF